MALTMISAEKSFPIPLLGPELVYLKNFITKPNIQVDDFIYYHDPAGADQFEKRNVLYQHEKMGDRLIIGKFCSIAMGTRFLMGGALHQSDGFSTYPFSIFSEEWKEKSKIDIPYVYKGDTVVGNDVWIGYESVVLPGITIGNGAIIGARAVVTKDIPAYTIVGGIPAKQIRKRFDDDTIRQLEEIKWWDWPIQLTTKNLNIILGRDITALSKICRE